jgi:hypothetical protein
VNGLFETLKCNDANLNSYKLNKFATNTIKSAEKVSKLLVAMFRVR